MTTATDTMRRALAREVLEDVLTTSAKLPVENSEGAQPIVVALADELLVDVWPRVDSVGRAANLFVRMNDGSLVLLEARYASVKSSRAHDLGTGPVDEGHTIGKMVELAAASEHGITFRVKPMKIHSFPGARSRQFAYVEVEAFAA